MVTICCKGTTFGDIQAVIFDKDGTLAQSEDFLRNLAQRRARLIDAQVPGVEAPLLLAFGVENAQINPAGLMAVGTRQENEIAAAAYVAETGREWLASLQLVQAAFAEADNVIQRKADHTPPTPGAIELVQTLSAAGLRLGVLSSDRTSNVADFVQTYGLNDYIQSQVGVDDRLSKSDPSLLQRCFAALGASPAQTLIIGDSQVDAQIALAVGAAGFIAVTGGWAASTHVAKADCSINHLSDIKVVC